jgi:hypothetical protein
MGRHGRYLDTGDCFVIAGQKREARLRTNDPAIQLS